MLSLPVDAAIPRILESLRAHPNLVLQAEPGAGKTTRVPPAVMGLLDGKSQVVVLEPRRLAARMAAQRVAEEGGHTLGGVVGYQVRFEEKVSAQTRVRFVTEQILVRQLLNDAKLSTVGAVILDEFHERHIHGDLALALLRRLQRSTRPDLKIVIMSATLDVVPVARFLGDCPVMDVPGRVFPVDVEFAAQPEPAMHGRPLEKQVADAVKKVVTTEPDGHVLCFLPGASEIRRAMDACSSIAQQHGLMLAMLHADLSPEEQDRAVRPSRERKVILSTNVAESSVTIDGVVAVVDSGLARIPSYAAWSGLPTLKVAKISRASAAQRAGRAGRTRAGRCIRLYTRHDHDTRPEHTPPEIKRLDLADTALLLHGLGVRELASFPFFEAPETSSLAAADALLRLLEAVGDDGELTASGKTMLRFPLHPRQARVLSEAASRGFLDEGALAAAILGERDITASTRRGAHQSDVTAAMDVIESLFAGGSVQRQAQSLGLDVGAVMRVDRTRKQLVQAARNARVPVGERKQSEEDAIRISVLAGYPDRVAQKRKGNEFLLATGGVATLAPSSAVTHSDLIVALDVEERTGGRDEGIRIQRASEIELDWLLDVAPHALRDVVAVEWNSQAQRVHASSRFMLFDLVLEEKELHKSDAPEVSELLGRMALNAGITRFLDEEELRKFQARVQIVRDAMPDAGLPSVDDDAVKIVLRGLCDGRRSFNELKEADLLGNVKDLLSHQQLALLNKEAPESIQLPGGRHCKVNYVVGQPPWVESRLQDFFGMRTTPRVLGGRVSLNVHLLAPNFRAVQITNDLAGFWERHYPGIRKELMRKYPKHLWPEDGQSAAPPPPNARRRN